MGRIELLATGALCVALAAPRAAAQDLLDRPVTPPPPSAAATPPSDEQVQFTSNSLEYDSNNDIVTAVGDVRMFRRSDRLRADRVTWNRRTGRVLATGNVAVTDPQNTTAYGDAIDLSDSLKDGVIENMLVVLDEGGRLAAARGTRQDDGAVTLDRAAYTACAVADEAGCAKEPSWKITAVRVAYRPDRQRVYYAGGRFHLLGFISVPLPKFSHPTGAGNASGFLTPTVRIDRVNGVEAAIPYLFRLAPNRALTVRPHIFTGVLPMMEAKYQAVETLGAYSITGFLTSSRRSDDLVQGFNSTSTTRGLRGYLDGVGRFQLDPNWSVSGSLRLASDRTFLRRYDISREDRLRTTVALERVDANSYLSLAGWAVQTMRIGERQGMQPVALPELDYRHRIRDSLLGGTVQFQLNTLAIGRRAGQDTQRAFAGARWDLRRITRWGQEVTFTGYGRADVYNANQTALTTTGIYRGTEGFQSRGIVAAAADVRWPFVGAFMGGAQRFTPRVQLVASPRTANLRLPNEDARAVDLEDSNLFALNRFSGYDRWEDASRVTYGAEWGLTLPGLTIDANAGQSYRVSERPSILPDGTGLSDRFSDIVGRTEVRFRDFVSLTHRYRLDKNSFELRRNEMDATIGSRSTYALVGYLRLNRDIALEDLQDREELRLAGRVAFGRFWSAYASGVIDLTDRTEDVFSLSDGFTPVRHRAGIEYEDDCLTIGATWRRDYRTLGDARGGNNYLFTLAFKNLGR